MYKEGKITFYNRRDVEPNLKVKYPPVANGVKTAASKTSFPTFRVRGFGVGVRGQGLEGVRVRMDTKR